MLCCNQECLTPFCPQCGKPMAEAHPLLALLAYLRAEALRVDQRAAKYRRGVKYMEEARQEMFRERAERQAAALREWAKGVEALLRKEEKIVEVLGGPPKSDSDART